MKTKLLMPTGDTVENTIPVFKTPWNHDTNLESDRTALFCTDPSLAKQEFKDDTDINKIMERILQGQQMPIVMPEHFLDLSGRETYFEMQTRLTNTKAMFYQLNADLRAQYLNDPARWADAVVAAANAGNGEALENLGIDVSNEKDAIGKALAANLAKTAAEHSSSGDPPPDTAKAPKKAPEGAKD